MHQADLREPAGHQHLWCGTSLERVSYHLTHLSGWGKIAFKLSINSWTQTSTGPGRWPAQAALSAVFQLQWEISQVLNCLNNLRSWLRLCQDHVTGVSPPQLESLHFVGTKTSPRLEMEASTTHQNDDLSPTAAISTGEEETPISLAYHIVMPGVAVLGLVGNVFIIVVMRRRKFRDMSTNVYLSVLAVCDSIVLLTGQKNLLLHIESLSFRSLIFCLFFKSLITPLVCLFQVQFYLTFWPGKGSGENLCFTCTLHPAGLSTSCFTGHPMCHPGVWSVSLWSAWLSLSSLTGETQLLSSVQK